VWLTAFFCAVVPTETMVTREYMGRTMGPSFSLCTSTVGTLTGAHHTPGQPRAGASCWVTECY
jgi:hypothetical protein